MTDVPLSETILRQNIPELKRAYVFETLGSTNDFAKDLLKTEPPELPILVLTHQQTQGRGRGDSRWLSDARSLSLSFIVPIPPRLTPGMFSILWGVTVAKTLNKLAKPEGTNCPFQVKWPNDIYAPEGKVAGILIESVATNPSARVVGVGVNLASQPKSSELRTKSQTAAPRTASSIREATGFVPTKISIIKSLWTEYARILKWSTAQVSEEFDRLNILRLKTVSLLSAGQMITGLCTGIDDAGRLCLECNQSPGKFASGSVIDWT